MIKKKRKKRPIDPVSRAELARLRGCAKSTASRACNGPLRDAMLGDRVDVNHPAVQKWLAAGASGPTSNAPSEQPAGSPVPPGDLPTRDDFLRVQFRRKEAEAARLESRNERDDGRLISRELVRTSVISYIETLNLRLLRNGAQTIATRVAAEAKGGASLEEMIELARGQISKELKEARRKAIAGIRDSATSDNPPEVQQPPAREDRAAERRAVRAFAAALVETLVQQAAPDLFIANWKAFARACGSRESFDAVMAQRHELETKETIRTARIIAHHVQRAVTDWEARDAG